MSADVQQILVAIAIIIVAAWNAWKEIRERKLTKKEGLVSNPQRCAEHAKRLEKIEDKQGKMSETIGRMDERIKEAQKDIGDIWDAVRKG